MTSALQTKPQVLVVDDDPTIRLLMQEVLIQQGLEVAEAADGAGALEAIARARPELVLLDVQMPGLDGFEVCRRIRADSDGDPITVVMVTGLDDTKSIERAYEEGATDFITKPINWPILGHRIRYLLRARTAFLQLRRSEARLAEAQRIARLGHWEWDIPSGSLIWSREVFRIFGLEPGEVEPTYAFFLEQVYPEDRAMVEAAVEEALRGNQEYALDHRIARPDGSLRILHEQAEVVRDPDGRPVRMSGTVQDITERRDAERRIRYLAYYDPLTGLPNRRLFQEQTTLELRHAEREGGGLALLYLDLDRFKQINETLGHDVGDEVLKQVAQRLEQGLRHSDVIGRGGTLFEVSHLGGDEFSILLSRIHRPQLVAEIARRLLHDLSHPFRVGEEEFYLSASIGAALYPEDGRDPDTLLRSADTALHHAKRTEGTQVTFYSNEMNVRVRQRLTLETRLRRALEEERLSLRYQPQVELATGRIAGVEALLRWHDPDLGEVSPARFISLAEETGLIVPIGEWVLRTACRQGRLWEMAGHRLHLGVNLSPIQFGRKDLLTCIERVLGDSGLTPDLLELELTEGTLMQDLSVALHALATLKELGIRLSVDDFGTGYSSLAYLQRFPLNSLKIDRSFIQNLTRNEQDATITNTVIALGHSLGLTLVAEGVEEPEQRDYLAAQGCDLIQGFLFGRPMPAADLTERLRAGFGPS